jgi:ABC-2 type transport system ATP-binding protein
MAASHAALEIHDARKRFGATPALDGMSLTLAEGELLGLLGPNGAGKTTLIRAIAGRLRLDGGSITLFGEPLLPGRPRRDLGVVPQENALYPLLTARENLETFGRLLGLEGKRLRERCAWALEWTGLADRAGSRVGAFSGGMKRRLNLACGVLHEPRLVLLDEPTVAVDPQSREKIHDMLAALRGDGASLLLSTHYLEEAEARCERIVVVDHGRTLAAGTLGELVEHAGLRGRHVRLTTDGLSGVVPAGFVREGESQVLTATVNDVGRELPELLQQLAAAGLSVRDLEVRTASLQSVFLTLTGKELRE